jgi:hypothetical protein
MIRLTGLKAFSVESSPISVMPTQCTIRTGRPISGPTPG